MKRDVAALLEEALALPAKDRTALAEALLVSLDGHAEDDTAAAWKAETERRVKELDEGTVAFWMKSSGSPSQTARLFGVGDNWEARQNTDGTLSFDICGDATPDVVTTTPLNEVGRWYHVVETFKASDESYAIYIDGQLNKSGTNSNAMSTQAADILSFGTRTGSTQYWQGALRDRPHPTHFTVAEAHLRPRLLAPAARGHLSMVKPSLET